MNGALERRINKASLELVSGVVVLPTKDDDAKLMASNSLGGPPCGYITLARRTRDHATRIAIWWGGKFVPEGWDWTSRVHRHHRKFPHYSAAVDPRTIDDAEHWARHLVADGVAGGVIRWMKDGTELSLPPGLRVFRLAERAATAFGPTLTLVKDRSGVVMTKLEPYGTLLRCDPYQAQPVWLETTEEQLREGTVEVLPEDIWLDLRVVMAQAYAASGSGGGA